MRYTFIFVQHIIYIKMFSSHTNTQRKKSNYMCVMCQSTVQGVIGYLEEAALTEGSESGKDTLQKLH